MLSSTYIVKSGKILPKSYDTFLWFTPCKTGKKSPLMVQISIKIEEAVVY
jgi:hypothetical protein